MLTNQELAEKLNTNVNNIRQWKFKLQDNLELGVHYTYSPERHLLWLEPGIEIISGAMKSSIVVTTPVTPQVTKITEPITVKKTEVVNYYEIDVTKATTNYRAELFAKVAEKLGRQLGNSLVQADIKTAVENVVIKTVVENL